MRPRHLIGACGMAIAIWIAPAVAQTQAPTQPDTVRLAQPARTPTAREIVPTAGATDPALSLFEGLWKVTITTNEQPREGAAPPSETPVTPASSRPGAAPAVSPSTDTSGAMLRANVTHGYVESHVIMNGNVLKETMVVTDSPLGVEGAMPGQPEISRPPTTSTPSSNTPDTLPTTRTPASRTPSAAEDRNEALHRLPSDQQMREGDVSTSFLSLDAATGTFSMVCMDGHSGTMKHTTGKYETEADRIVFETAGDGSASQVSGSNIRPRTLTPDRPTGNAVDGITTKNTPPSSTPTLDQLEPTGVSGVTPPRTDSRGQPIRPEGSLTPEGERSLRDQPVDRPAPDRPLTPDQRDNWSAGWGDNMKIVVEIIGNDERRVTVYRTETDPSSISRDTARLPERPGEAPTGVPERDQVRATPLAAGMVVCQATYTRVAEAEATRVRTMMRDHDLLAAADRE